jgi:hypothetical protein
MNNKIEKEFSRLELADYLENLQRAVAEKQLEVVEHELRDLRTRWVTCHRDFK